MVSTYGSGSRTGILCGGGRVSTGWNGVEADMEVRHEGMKVP